MDRRCLMLILAGAVSLAISATGHAETKKANGETLRIQEYPGSINNLPAWVAIDTGKCQAHSINCVMVGIPSGPLGLQAVAGGGLEIGFASTDVIMQSAARGNDVQLLVGVNPGIVYTLNTRKGLKLPHLKDGYPSVMKDLVGLKIGVTARGSATETITRALLAGAGLKPEDVTFVAVGAPSSAYPALTVGHVDAVMMFEPVATLCKVEDSCNEVIDLRKGDGPPDLRAMNGGANAYYSSRKYIGSHKNAVGAYAQAIEDANEWIKNPENEARLFDIVRKRISLANVKDPDRVLRELIKNVAPTFDAKIVRSAVKAHADYLLKYGMIDSPYNPSGFIYEAAP